MFAYMSKGSPKSEQVHEAWKLILAVLCSNEGHSGCHDVPEEQWLSKVCSNSEFLHSLLYFGGYYSYGVFLKQSK